MKQVNVKKLILPNIPYVFIALLATKVSEAVRLAPGSDASTKLLNIMTGLNTAFHSLVPSFHPIDLCVGVAAAIAIRLAVYIKGKNAKKFRKNLEYGSARWGNAEDIKPYVDPAFENNIILTQTERLTMNSRPKDPKTARNKNVLIVGGSGSGKTRFWLKPTNLPWYNKVKSKITLESLFLQPFHTRERGNTMSRFQAGALVVYGNLGVHEVEGVGLRRFCDESAREYYTLRPYFSDSHDRSYIPTEKEAALRPVTPAQQAEADLARIKAEKLPIPAGIQTALAEHYQALLHTNDFYQYLTLFKELGQKQTQQQSRGRKINAMDTYFYQMVERVLREELAVAFGESQQEAGRRLLEVLR